MNTINACNSSDVNQLIGATKFGTNRNHAVLYLFSKRYIPDQYRRSFVYNFDHEFNEDLNDTVSKLKTVGGLKSADYFMRGSSAAVTSIMPEASGSKVNTSTFSHQWTFMLIVDSIRASEPWENAAGSSPVRDIYTGFVLEDPVWNHFGGYRMNPQAVYSTTHHTRLNAYQELGPAGMFRSMQVLDDKDYLNGESVQNLQYSGETLMDIRPEKIANSISTDNQLDSSNFSTAPSPVEASRTSIPIDSCLNSPAHHLNKLVGGMAATIRLMQCPSAEMTQFDLASGTDVLINSLGMNLSTGVSSVYGAINPDRPFNFEDINSRFPDVDIQIIRQPEGATIEYGDSGVAHPRNTFSSLIASAMPGILVNNNLADVAFTYYSLGVEPNALPGVTGCFEFQNVGPLFAMTPDMVSAKIELMKQELSRDIFPIIRASCGEFYLMIKSSVAGETVIDLRLLDWTNNHPTGYIEQSNRLGGINTPLVGVTNVHNFNAGQLFNTIRTIGEANQFPTSDYFY